MGHIYNMKNQFWAGLGSTVKKNLGLIMSNLFSTTFKVNFLNFVQSSLATFFGGLVLTSFLVNKLEFVNTADIRTNKAIF